MDENILPVCPECNQILDEVIEESSIRKWYKFYEGKYSSASEDREIYDLEFHCPFCDTILPEEVVEKILKLGIDI